MLVCLFRITMSCFRRLLTDFSLGAATAGDAERLRESEREKSEDPPSWFSISRPRRAGLRSGDDGIEPLCAVSDVVVCL
jgi:hypothetical protein